MQTACSLPVSYTHLDVYKRQGQRLLSHVEEEGRRQGARRVELNTFGFQAPGFYEKLGYRLIGKVEPSVRAYGHYYYEKDL